MSGIVPTLATALLPLASYLSLSIYLSVHPASPLRALYRRRQSIALPTHQNEPLNSEKDPFDFDDSSLGSDGTPIQAEKFWKSMRRRKIALLFVLLVPMGINVGSIVLLALDSTTVIRPVLILAAQAPTVLTTFWHISQITTATSWPTTVTLAINIALQTITLAILALLSRHNSINLTLLAPWSPIHDVQPIPLLETLLPIAYIPAFLLVMCFIRRGPPLHLPVEDIYPAKIYSSIPSDHRSLDHTVPNVTEEVQSSVLGVLIYSYATPVIKLGAESNSLDLWDVPLLTADMRTSHM
jgi:hypothetical protein